MKSCCQQQEPTKSTHWFNSVTGRNPRFSRASGCRKTEGEEEINEAELIEAARFTPGAELTLAQLQQMAARIADFYHARGYFLAQAYLPAQDITDGSVSITVVEAQYDKVDMRLSTRLSEPLARRLLGEVKPGATVASGALKPLCCCCRICLVYR